jgi:hypothetical protein
LCAQPPCARGLCAQPLCGSGCLLSHHGQGVVCSATMGGGHVLSHSRRQSPPHAPRRCCRLPRKVSQAA